MITECDTEFLSGKSMDFKHISVMAEETLEALKVRPDGIYVDGTLGGGGHAYSVCQRLTTGRLIGIDRDEDALKAAGMHLKQFGDKAVLVHGNFCNMVHFIDNMGIGLVNGILLDLGVSSYQIDEPGRGFSYMQDESPLDMRMDRRQSLTAAGILNTYPESELVRIFKDYGEERFAPGIAKRVVTARESREIATAGELNSLIREAIPGKYLKTLKGHPSKRVFQALRIETNSELEELKNSIDGMIDRLDNGGRLCIITFHSLEDRIVKSIFRKNESPCTCPPSFPVCVCGKVSKGKVITKRPVIPTKEELERNSRSASAKLRVFERVIDLIDP